MSEVRTGSFQRPEGKGSLLIRGGRVIDPSQGIDRVADVVVRYGKIVEITSAPAGAGGNRPGVAGDDSFDEVIDAAGLIVAPGLVDIHVHLREPGQEWKEDIASGTRAAAAGGFTSVCCMPNTKPVIDTPEVLHYVRQRARETGFVNVFPIGAITKGSQGKEITEMGELREAGAVAFSDDGKPVQDAEVMRCALEYAKMFDVLVIQHAEERSLAGEGVMNLGRVSTLLGLRGMPPAAEDVMVARDIILAEMTGARYHVAHISTRGAVDLVRQAKRRGLPVSCEATPHHFTLTDETVRTMRYDTNTKMNPPLRCHHDVEAIIEGLKDGTIDAIATDHAPHHVDCKDVEYNYACFGITGLETALGLTITQLVEPGHLTLSEAIGLLTYRPARLIGLDKGTLRPGTDADILLFNETQEYTVDVNQHQSKSRNSPFHGWKLRGLARYTVVGGRVVYRRTETA